MTPSIIAIDGPAASGKSTIGALLAEKLRYLYFDSGVMYRAITWVALDRGVPIQEETAVTNLAQTVRIDVLAPDVDDGRQYTIRADGRDITWEIRERRVDANVSPVSAYPGVRQALSAQQRRIGLRGKVVMVGRDIGTVVLPQADFKIYLDASEAERARRRYQERVDRGEEVEYASVLAEIRRRDEIDSSRSVAPLKKADDAVYVDSTNLSVQQVIDHIVLLLERAEPKLTNDIRTE